MNRIKVRSALLCAILSIGACGCAGNPVSEQQKAAFAAARDRCGVTVAETEEVKRCMRAQGWAYRHPWQ